ncbi:MAG: hypothetical protein WAV32_07900 [Halobacteriota archaeon]
MPIRRHDYKVFAPANPISLLLKIQFERLWRVKPPRSTGSNTSSRMLVSWTS